MFAALAQPCCRSALKANPPASRQQLRRFSPSAPSREQHLLWAGTLLDETQSVHKPLSQDLFLAAGASDDFAKGDITLGPIAASPTRGHSLLSYKTAPPECLSRVFAAGRNSYGQLGIGFASQEATFGLVRPGFSGVGGLSRLQAGPAQSWLLTNDEQGNQRGLFACGNNTLGQLGCPAVRHQGPQLQLLPAPYKIELGSEHTITSSAVGLDHTLISLQRNSKGKSFWSLRSAGLNTDGQLGRGLADSSTHDHAFESVSLSDEVEIASPLHVAAGGDTSFAWTDEPETSSRVWVWGNNEYKQCLSGRLDEFDQVTTPTEVTDVLAASLGPNFTVRDIKVGGSWTAVLDAHGSVWVAGYAMPGDTTSTAALTRIALPPITSLAANNDAVFALTKCRRRLFVWGIESSDGVLGLGNPRVENTQLATHGMGGRDTRGRFPFPLEIPTPFCLGEDGTIEQYCLGGDQSWILIEDGQEPRNVWRGSEVKAVTMGKSKRGAS